jgi:hypothetical protein
MSRARNLADLLDANGDVASGALDNVPPSNDASALTTGTLPIARIADGAVTAAKLASDATNLVADTSPQLGGDLDPNGYGVSNHWLPSTNDSYDLGSTSAVWRNIYTGDLHLSNQAKEQGNAVDGTKGNWTVQEGQNELFILNNVTGRKYKFLLQEIE